MTNTIFDVKNQVLAVPHQGLVISHIKVKIFFLILQLSFSLFTLCLIYTKPSVLYSNPEFLSYLYVSILNSIHSMYLCIKLLYDIEINPGPNIPDDYSSEEEIDYYHGALRIPPGTPLRNIQAHEHNTVHCELEGNFQTLSAFYSYLMLCIRGNDSNYLRLFAYSIASYIFFPNRYAQNFFLTYFDGSLSLLHMHNQNYLQFSLDLSGDYIVKYNNIEIDPNGFDFALYHVFSDILDLQPEVRDEILTGEAYFDCQSISTLVSMDNPDVTAILLMHDVELNPGEIYNYFKRQESYIVRIVENIHTESQYKILLEIHKSLILAMHIEEELNIRDPKVYECYDRIHSMIFFEAPSALYMKGIKLMHDIESNPGPHSYSRLVALYLDCMNYAASIKDDEFISKYHPLLLSEYNDIFYCTPLSDDNSVGCLEIKNHIYDFLHVTPQMDMLRSLNPLNGIVPAVNNLADGIKGMKVGIEHETLEYLLGIATKVSEVSVDLDPRTKDFLTPKIPDALNLTNIFLWLQSPKNATCVLSSIIVILILCRQRYPSNVGLLSLCSAFGVIAILYLNSPTIMSYLSTWIFPSVKPQSDDTDWFSIITETLSFGFFSRSITFKDTDSIGKSIAAAEKYSKGVGDYIERLKNLIVKIVSKLGETFGMELNLGFNRHANIIQSYTSRLMALKLDPAMFDGNVTFEFSRSVQRLENDINAYIAKLAPDKNNSSYHIALRNTLLLMNPLLALCRNSHIRRVVRRTPFNINFVGPSGVGKTQLSSAVIPLVFCRQATAADLERANDNFFSMCFVQGPGEKFSDTYDDQFAWLYNDFLAKLESEGAQQSEILMFIQMLGSSPLPLNCAEISKKGLIMFSSDFIVTSMNAYRITQHVVKVLTHLNALIRRINDHLNCLVTIKPEYRSIPNPEPGVVYPYPDPKFYCSLDKTKAMALDHPNGINTDIYVFDEWDSGTGQYKVGGFRNYNFNQYMEVLYARYQTHITHQDRINAQTSVFIERVTGDRLLQLQQEANRPHQQADDNIWTEDMPELISDCELNNYIQDLDIDPENVTDNLLAELALDIHNYEENNRDILVDSLPDESVSRWLRRYISTCVEDGIRYLIGPEYGCYKDKNDPMNMMLQGANWVDLFYLSQYDFCDTVILHSLRLRHNFCDVLSAAHTLSLSLMKRIHSEFIRFKFSPLLWLKSNPYLGLIGIGATATTGVLVFKSLNIVMDWAFRIFNFAPDFSASETESDIRQQSNEKPDKDMEFMRKPLYNFYSVRIRATVPSINKFINVTPSQAFAIADHTLELPYHVIVLCDMYKLRKGVTKVEIGLIPVNTRLTVPSEWFNIEDLTIDRIGKSVDIARVTFPSSLDKFPCIKRYIPKKTPELLKLIQSRDFLTASAFVIRGGILAREKVKVSYNGHFNYPLVTTMMDPLARDTITLPSIDVDIEHSLKIDFPTIDGDCYMAVFIDDPIIRTLTSVDPQLQNPILAYRHLAGNPSVHLGYGALMFRDDFDSIESSGLKCPQLLLEEDSILRKLKLEELLPMNQQNNSTELVSVILDPPKHLAPHHPIQMSCLSIPMSRNNPIARSELFKDIKYRYGITKMPVRLFPSIDGIDPMSVARESYGNNLEFSLNYKVANLVADEVVNELFSVSGPILHTRVYTTMEVLEGVPDEGIRSNDRSTSWGYQMKALAKIYNFTGDDLRWAFGKEDRYEYTSVFARLVLSLCAHYDLSLQSGEDFAHVYMDCLKAECKDSDNARLFCACDKIFLLKCKQYFGGFANWIYVNRIKNGIAIGINPYAEWDIFYKWLTEVAHYGIFGDYKKYDKRQVSFLMFVTRLCYTQYYSGTPAGDCRARDILFSKMVKTLHVALDKGTAYIYEWFHGNTSGNLLTAIINSITGLFIVKYCCCDILLLEKGGIDAGNGSNLPVIFKILRKKIRTIVYGDDNGIMVHESLRHRIHFYSIQTSIEKCFNLVYTDEMKGKRLDYVVPHHTHILEGNFIARGFRFEGSMVVGPLREISMFESLAWYKNIKDREELVRNVERVLKECSARGKSYFYQHQPFLSDICIKRLGSPPRFQLWEAAFAAFQCEESLYFDPSFIYGHLNIEGFFSTPDYGESEPEHPLLHDDALKVTLSPHF